MERGDPCLLVTEYPLYTDAWITGEIEQGPYQFLNPVCLGAGQIRPAIVLRCSRYAKHPYPDMKKTAAEHYHGGSFPEELAALSSLILGIRLKAGGMTRFFETNGDPKGTLVGSDVRPISNNITRKPPWGWIVPSATKGSYPLDPLQILSRIPKMAVDAVTALIRAARLYQDALWIVESEPALAWIMLVSAIEAAANHWRKLNDSPIERLKASKPNLYNYLRQVHIQPEVAEVVAKEISGSLGSTKKFRDFVFAFAPPAPSRRPPHHQLDRTPSELRKTIDQVYKYRSRALHDGSPFPAPMCEAPFCDDTWEAPAEIPTGLASSAKGGTWLIEDTRILLHTFEYMTRNVLLKWWESSSKSENP